MATIGEECSHQDTIRYYFDISYDLNFDAEAQHYCQHFGEVVIPARRCGTSCSAFRPLRGGNSPTQTRMVDGNDELANDTRVRAFLRKRLDIVRNDAELNALYLERQLPERQRRWLEMDEWLSQQGTQPEALSHEVAQSEHRLALAMGQLQHIQHQLDSARSHLKDVRDLERLWLEQAKLEHDVQSAKRARRQAREKMIEREKMEAEQAQIYAKWDDALERVPLLRQLCDLATRRVEALLADSRQPLSDEDVEYIVRFLRGVSAYSTDDVRLSTLRTVIKYLQSM